MLWRGCIGCHPQMPLLTTSTYEVARGNTAASPWILQQILNGFDLFLECFTILRVREYRDTRVYWMLVSVYVVSGILLRADRLV